MPYIGNQFNDNFSSLAKQSITGNGGANYVLSTPVANANEIEVFVNNVRQEPLVAYTVTDTSLAMTGNVASTDDFYVVYQGKAVQTTIPPDDSVGANQLAHNFTFPGAVAAPVQTASIAGNTTLDFNTYQHFVLTMTNAVTLSNPTTGAVGQTGFIALIQDGTGGRTLSLGSDFETAAAAGITLTTTASATDFIPYAKIAANRILLGTPQLAFA